MRVSCWISILSRRILRLMQYQEAVRLGRLHQQLGIAADARICLKMLPEGSPGVFIWNLENGKTYVVIAGAQPIVGQMEIPEHVKNTIKATDDDLKQYWLSTMGWGEQRETVFSELAFRGINVLKLEGIG